MPAGVTPLGSPGIVGPVFAPLPPLTVLAVGRRTFVTAPVPHGPRRVAVKQIGRVRAMDAEMVMKQGARIVVVVPIPIRETTLRAAEAAIVEVVGGPPVVGRTVTAVGAESQGEGNGAHREARAHGPCAACLCRGGEGGCQQHPSGSDRGEGLFAHPSAPLLRPLLSTMRASSRVFRLLPKNQPFSGPPARESA